MVRFSRYQFGLRARLSLTFALGALLLSTVLSFLAWGLTRESLMAQKVDTAVEDVLRNAVTVRKGLTADGNGEELQDLLSSLSSKDRATPIVHHDGRWQGQDTLNFGHDDLPVALTSLVETEQQAGRMQFRNQ